MTLVTQICMLVSLPDNCGTNPSWYGWSWSSDNANPELLSVYFLVDPYFLPFFLHCLLLSSPNMHNAQRGTSYFKSRNLDGRTPSFASINTNLVWRLDSLSWQGLNPYCKGIVPLEKWYYQFVLVWDSLIHWYNNLRKF